MYDVSLLFRVELSRMSHPHASRPVDGFVIVRRQARDWTPKVGACDGNNKAVAKGLDPSGLYLVPNDTLPSREGQPVRLVVGASVYSNPRIQLFHEYTRPKLFNVQTSSWHWKVFKESEIDAAAPFNLLLFSQQAPGT
jgi:hypothetical protein